MADIDKTIKSLKYHLESELCCSCVKDAVDLLIEYKKSQDKTVNTWKHLWDAPDGSFKGRCENCGFVHFFVEGHDAQYRFCPQCGEQKVT